MAQVTEPALLDLVHDAVMIRERDGRIVAWNRAAEQRYGHAAAEALGRNLHELLKTMYLGHAVDEAIARDGYWEGEVRATGRHGEVLLSSCRQKLVENARILEVHGTPASRMGTDLRLVIDHVPGLVSYISTDLDRKSVV